MSIGAMEQGSKSTFTLFASRCAQGLNTMHTAYISCRSSGVDAVKALVSELEAVLLYTHKVNLHIVY